MEDLRSASRYALVILMMLAVAGAPACGSDSDDAPAQVLISGGHSLAPGGSTTLLATTSGGEDPGYTWASDDDTVATVDAGGTVTGVAPGEVTISATGDATGAVGQHVIVVAAGAARITVAGGHGLAVGATLSLVPTTQGGTDSAYSFASDDEGIASVDAAGTVLGVSAGETAIVVTGVDTAASATHAIVVMASGSSVVAVSGGHTVEVGAALQLAATTTGGEDPSYTWASGDSEIATVDTATGLVTGVAPGEVVVTATGDSTGAVGIHPVVVTSPSGPVVTTSGSHQVVVGAAISLSATTEGGTDTGYTWDTGDDDVATVDATGTVTGVAAGEVQITATGTDTGASGTHTVVVLDEVTPVVVVDGEPLVQIGGTALMTATTVNAADASYTWVSDDPSVATVDATGLVTGRAVGSATITATGASSGAVGTFSIRVRNEIPHYDEWVEAPHANRASPSFNHWNDEDPPEIPAECARCHSTSGYRDYLGDDGSMTFAVDAAHPVGSVIECRACHSPAAEALTRVIFPSGIEVDGLGPEARCMTCHQGLASGAAVDAAVADLGLADDESSAELGFVNIHYFAAGATLNAGRVEGGYQYPGKLYDWRFRHVAGRDTCVGCHDPHSQQLRLDGCQECHGAAEPLGDPRDIRMASSFGVDYDGDDDVDEGIHYELVGLADVLLEAIARYAEEHALDPICYDSDVFPYFFVDTDESGACETGEAVDGNAYAAWTPRLLRAAYNHQVFARDPGAFAHNAKYTIQLLYDSIADLSHALDPPIDLSALTRQDSGHFNGAAAFAREWDAAGEVPASCARCHGGSTGFLFFLEHGVSQQVKEPPNALDCATCHASFGGDFDVWSVGAVEFASGQVVDMGARSNLCSLCHMGRYAGSDVDDRIAGGRLGFLDPHGQLAASLTAGAVAGGGYEYPGKTYAASWDHQPGNSCTFCHNPITTGHSFRVADAFPTCTDLCHTTAASPEAIRGNPFFPGVLHALDYDSDGSATEPLADELQPLREALLTRMRISADLTGPPLCYTANGAPYFFQDTNDNGVCDGGERSYPNRYTAWTPALMKAAFNLRFVEKDAGAWAHNFDYAAQLLYDSIEDLGGGGAVAAFIRP